MGNKSPECHPQRETRDDPRAQEGGLALLGPRSSPWLSDQTLSPAPEISDSPSASRCPYTHVAMAGATLPTQGMAGVVSTQTPGGHFIKAYDSS